jgi:hypothetical protein
MFKKLLFLLAALLLPTTTAHAGKVGGISMPDTLKASHSNLVLNGAGIRTKFFLKLYVGGLYLANPSHNAAGIIEADAPMAIRLHIISSMITSKRMEKATREGFANATRGNISPIQPQIEEFIAVFKEKINDQDIYDLIYTPSKGVEVYKNDSLRATIKGLAFKQAMFGIWLCDRPAQKSLKKDMLGK